MTMGTTTYLNNPATNREDNKQSGVYGVAYVTDPAAAPVGSITRGEDQGIANTSTQAFTGATATYLQLTVAQFANAGSAAQYADVYFVFNSSDPTTDLTNPAVREALSVQNGIGISKVISFAPNSLSSMHYKSTNTSADLVVRWTYK